MDVGKVWHAGYVAGFLSAIGLGVLWAGCFYLVMR
jgi:hypothetical protein